MLVLETSTVCLVGHMQVHLMAPYVVLLHGMSLCLIDHTIPLHRHALASMTSVSMCVICSLSILQPATHIISH